MKRLRTFSAALIALPLISLAACGGGDTKTTAATSSASAVATSAAPSAVAAGSDLAICQAAEVAKKALVATVSAGSDSSGKVPPATAKKALADLSDAMATMAAGGSGKLATIAGQVGVEAKKLSATPDPLKADDAAFTKAGDSFDAACKAAGFTTTS